MKHFSSAEIVELGIEIEKNGKRFYSALAQQLDDPLIEDTILFLASEEEKHITTFTEILEGIKKRNSEGIDGRVYNEEYYLYLNRLAQENVFKKDVDIEEMVSSIKEINDAIQIALQFEKDTIVFLSALANIATEDEKKIISILVNEENSHIQKLFFLLS